jgi:uncharacterized membrane protein YhaH (DUF805 family)
MKNRFGPKPKPVDFGEAIQICFSKYFEFKGRASRSEFWYFFLLYIIISIVAEFTINSSKSELIIILVAIASYGTIIPMISAGCRRMHDIDMSGWFQCIPFYNLYLWAQDNSSTQQSYTPSLGVKNNDIIMFDHSYELKDYKDRYCIEAAKHFNKSYKQKDVIAAHIKEFKKVPQKNFKFKFETRSKYWNTECIYPKSEDDFIEQFLKDKKLKPLEGIWEGNDWGILGIVKEGSYYQMYDLKIRYQTYIAERKEYFDFSIVDGTKGGAITPTSSKNKFNGVSRTIFLQHHDDGTYNMLVQSIKTKWVLKDPYLLKGKFLELDLRDLSLRRTWPLKTNKSSDDIDRDNGDIVDRIKKLKQLYKDGTLSKAQFNKAKKKLLG